MGQSQTGVNVEFVIIDDKVVPVAFSARRSGMYPDFNGQYPEVTDNGQLEDMVADFLEDFGVNLDDWDEDGDGGMGKQEIVALVGELMAKAAKKQAPGEDEEDEDEEDEDEGDEDEEDEDEEDEDEGDEDEGDEPGQMPMRHDKRHPATGRFIPKGSKAVKRLLMLENLLSKKHVGFNKLASSIASRSGVGEERAKAIAAAIGRRKYGKKKMAAASHAGKPLKASQALHKPKES